MITGYSLMVYCYRLYCNRTRLLFNILDQNHEENHKNEGRVITNSPQVAFQKYITNVTILLYFPNHVSYYYISRLVIRKPFIVEDE